MRSELTDFEWAAIKPMLPNKPRGVPRVDDRRFLNGNLGPAIRRAMARSAWELWPLHDLLQSFRPLATGWMH
jgi:transposase